MDFDFKVTTWERVSVPKEYEAEVLQAIKDGKVNSASDVWGIFDDAEIKEADGVASEQMTVEDNDGKATIEVIDNRGITIFENNK